MRKYLPTLAELLDRLSIVTMKEVMIPEHKEDYYQEKLDIVNDLNEILKEKEIVLTAETLHNLIVLAQLNAHIWYNEASARKGNDQDLWKLKLTHGLNGIRNMAKNKIEEIAGGGRKDYKTDCLAAEFTDWEVKWI